jgi:hypothetical protein
LNGKNVIEKVCDEIMKIKKKKWKGKGKEDEK